MKMYAIVKDGVIVSEARTSKFYAVESFMRMEKMPVTASNINVQLYMEEHGYTCQEVTVSLNTEMDCRLCEWYGDHINRVCNKCIGGDWFKLGEQVHLYGKGG